MPVKQKVVPRSLALYSQTIRAFFILMAAGKAGKEACDMKLNS
ncbi:hypothetical protein C823_003530 [Eubacterium plexicaudatum ASF492]|nr:hypothetical protein C823_003530 [Eubacterium plexicaudatum ASF492]